MIEMNGKLEMAIVKNMAANLGQIAVCLLHCLTFVLNSIWTKFNDMAQMQGDIVQVKEN